MQFIPPMPSITALAYELAHKAMLEGWDIKIDMNKGKQKHEIHCKPSVIAPHVTDCQPPAICNKCGRSEQEADECTEDDHRCPLQMAKLAGVIAPAPDQGSVRGYEPDCADCPTPADCKAKNDCQVMRQTRHGGENVFRRLYAEEAHKRAVESEQAAERIAQLEADQGSVRNATDEQNAKRYRQARTMQIHFYGDHDPHGAYIYHSGTSLDAAIDAAIRALPDQKD